MPSPLRAGRGPVIAERLVQQHGVTRGIGGTRHSASWPPRRPGITSAAAATVARARARQVGRERRCRARAAQPPGATIGADVSTLLRCMQRLETRLDGPILLEPVVHGDPRGFFHESYRKNVYAEIGIPDDFVQDNHSRSKRGDRPRHALPGRRRDGQAGALRHAARSSTSWSTCGSGSPTFGEWEAYELDDENLHQLYCPIGFAHGFCVTSESADVIYKCSAYYDEAIERGINYDDPDVGIDWPAGVEMLPSDRDANAPLLRDVEAGLPFTYSG